MNTENTSLGIQTAETLVLACQCGSSAYRLARRTATAVVVTCARCEAKVSVKGALAPVRVSAGELAFAIPNKMISPEPPAPPAPVEATDAETPAEADTIPGLDGGNYSTFRFRVTPDQASTVRRALEAIRILNAGADEYRAKTWQGHAIEALSADFLSGCDPRVLEIIDRQEEAVAVESARLAAEGRALTTRGETQTRNKVRETLAAQLAEPLGTPPHVDDELLASQIAHATSAAEKAAAAEAETRVLDEGRLMLAVQACRDDLLAPTGLRVVNETGLAGLVEFAEQSGGFVLRIDGDEGTRNGAGRRPAVWAWLSPENEDATFSPLLYMRDLYPEILDPLCVVVELVPTEADWEAPACAEVREVVTAIR